MKFPRALAAAALPAGAACGPEGAGQAEASRHDIREGGVSPLPDRPARLKELAGPVPPAGGVPDEPDPAARPEDMEGEEPPVEAEQEPALKARPIMGEAEIQLRIHRIASTHGLDPLLVEAVVRAESEFDPHAVSPRGAMGLMQITEQTARHLGVENPMDVEGNLEGGMKYLKELLQLYPGDLTLALAAYNAGPNAVKRHKGIPPYLETRRYVKRVMREYQALTRQAKLDFDF